MIGDYNDPIEQIATRDGVLAGVPLVPCPFCGEQRAFRALIDLLVLERADGSIDEQSTVACDRCGSHGPGADGGADGAVALWNARSRPQ